MGSAWESGGENTGSRPTRGLDPAVSQPTELGQPLCGQPELLRHDGVPDAAHEPAVRRGETAQRHHVRGHRRGQRPLPRPDEHAAEAHGVSRGDCTGSRSYYFSPHGETYLRATSTHTTVS